MDHVCKDITLSKSENSKQVLDLIFALQTKCLPTENNKTTAPLWLNGQQGHYKNTYMSSIYLINYTYHTRYTP